jgi:N utilization substance protein B
LSDDDRLAPRDRIDRSRARAWALQIHYRWEAGGAEGTLRDALVETMGMRRLLGVLDEHLVGIDDALRSALDNWRLERLSTLDRAVLRIGTAELLWIDEVPPKVAIQEAIRLAEAYGGPESPRFVNGVLDALYKRHAGPASGP